MRAPALAVVALVVVAGMASFARAGSGSRTLTTGNAIQSISASGSLVAIAPFTVDGGCDQAHALIWNASTGATTALKDPCSSQVVFSDLTLAGDTAIWWDYSAGNHVYCDDVYTASAASPKAHPLGICDGTMGDTYFEFAGDRSLVAISDYTVCEIDCTGPQGGLLPNGNYSVEVMRLRGSGRPAPVLTPHDFRVFLDARSWRVAVIEPKATLTVYDAGGRKLWSVPQVTGVFRGWIAGNTVVLQQTRSVRVYSASGAGVARPLPRGARLNGVVGGLGAYTIGSTVRLLRLADGRDRKLVTAKGLAGAQLTPAGVFYAAGRTVTFVPIRAALQILR